MFGLVLSVGLIVWIIVICIEFIKPERIQLRVTAEHSVNVIAFLLLALTVYLLYLAHENEEDLYGNFATSIGSIAVTVILIDRLNARRALEQRKQEIFEEMESRVRDVAVEAVRLARKHGWLDEALKKVNLENAQLAGVDFSYANLAGVDFSRAELAGANLNLANLQAANLDGANLQAAQLIGTNLQRAQLMGAHLDGANLQEANLNEAYLGWANLEGANLEGANLDGANLQRANLQEADLNWAHLEKASLIGVEYDHNTKWPKGFSPKAAGAIFVED